MSCYLMLLPIEGHGERSVCDLVGLVLLVRLNNKRGRPAPLLPLYDWTQVPQLVRFVLQEDRLGLPGADLAHKIHHLGGERIGQSDQRAV